MGDARRRAQRLRQRRRQRGDGRPADGWKQPREPGQHGRKQNQHSSHHSEGCESITLQLSLYSCALLLLKTPLSHSKLCDLASDSVTCAVRNNKLKRENESEEVIIVPVFAVGRSYNRQGRCENQKNQVRQWCWHNHRRATAR